MANLDKQLSQEVKRHQLEEKQMKYVITQLVNQKQELEEKLAKTAMITPTTQTITITKPLSKTSCFFITNSQKTKPNQSQIQR
jgi:uncharacterized membrane-anchored protein YhcB (DUF1043 family)